jgi:hypothetical protein
MEIVVDEANLEEELDAIPSHSGFTADILAKLCGYIALLECAFP